VTRVTAWESEKLLSFFTKPHLQVPSFRYPGSFCRIQDKVAATEKIKFQDEVVANIPRKPHTLTVQEEKEKEGTDEKEVKVRNRVGCDSGGCVRRWAVRALKIHS
ncbi:NACA2 protein, partial [Crocuta crocuta]